MNSNGHAATVLFPFINMLSKVKSHIYCSKIYFHKIYWNALAMCFLSLTDELADSILIILLYYHMTQLWMTNNVGMFTKRSIRLDNKYPKIVMIIMDFVHSGNHFYD